MRKAKTRIAPPGLIFITRCLILAVSLSAAFAQDRTGELRLNVTDPSGATVQAHCEIVSQANHFLLAFETNAQGEYTLKELPFGSYKVTVQHPGFAPFTALVEV